MIQFTNPTIVMAFDGGLANTGIAIGGLRGGERWLEHTETIRTTPDMPDSERFDVLSERALKLIDKHRPLVVAVEAHVYFAGKPGSDAHTAKRSQNAQLPQTARVSGMFEGIARFGVWQGQHRGKVYVIPKSQTNVAIGLRGKVPAQRVREIVEALWKVKGKRGGLLSDAHQVDAAGLMWVAAQRWSVDSRLGRTA